MIHVLITVKPSTRCPGKNAELARYTVPWLANELLHTPEEVRVYTVGVRTELPDDLPQSWQHIECATGTHRGDVEYAEAQILPAAWDVLLLVQVTQPLRRRKLLADVAAMARRCGCAVTACKVRQGDWRTLTTRGSWADRKGPYALHHDGALYGWLPGKAALIFEPAAEHGVVINYDGPVVDIDTAADVPPALTAAFAELLCGKNSLQP